jgi:hypothetical protein
MNMPKLCNRSRAEDRLRELAGVTGADPSGLAPGDLTVLNGEVLFSSLDSSGRAAGG